MVAGEPRVRRRGFFLFSTEVNEPDSGEHENPEGFVVRAPGRKRHSASRPVASAAPRPAGARPSGGRSEPPVGSRHGTDDSSTSD